MHRRELEFALSRNPEESFLSHIDDVIREAKSVPRPSRDETAIIQIFLAGYVGAGNVGSEMRVHELVRQLRWLLTGVECRFTVLSRKVGPIKGALPDVRSFTATHYIPEALPDLVSDADAVIACEGSTFKSNFSDALSATMAGALALANNSDRLSMAYGAEVGPPSPRLEGLLRRHLNDILVLARNQVSVEKARDLGMRARLGTDTGWTYEPTDSWHEIRSSVGPEPYLVICPTNPFWWPVRPNPRLALRQDRQGIVDPWRYDTVFYHNNSEESENLYRSYITRLAEAAGIIANRRGLKPVILAMETLDSHACQEMARALPGSTVLIGSGFSLDFVVGLLRKASMLISSRYHALLAAMPAAVPSIGISTDERIPHLYEVDSPPVLDAFSATLSQDLLALSDNVNAGLAVEYAQATIGNSLRLLSKMGEYFLEELCAKCPNLEIRREFGTWRDFLPPISDRLAAYL